MSIQSVFSKYIAIQMEMFVHACSDSSSILSVVSMGSLENTDFALRVSPPIILPVTRLSNFLETFPTLTSEIYEMSAKEQGLGLGSKSSIKFSGETVS